MVRRALTLWLAANAGCGGLGTCSQNEACGWEDCPETVEAASALCGDTGLEVQACDAGTRVVCTGYMGSTWTYDADGTLVATSIHGEDALPVICGEAATVGACTSP